MTDMTSENFGRYPARRVSVARSEADGLRYYFSEVALGNVTGRMGVNKFGAAPDGLQVTLTDVWDRADATPTQQIWLAPTAARTHAITSTSAEDAAAGDGSASLQIYGLTGWDTAEVSETITLNGTGNVNTANDYVIIHRMKCTPQASTVTAGMNAGTITATAAVDGTVTAAILPGNGQTEMAIYGIPSTQTMLVHNWRANIDKAAAQARTCSFRLMLNPNPDVQTVAFQRKDDISVQSNGKNADNHRAIPPMKFAGPCILKVQGIASAADIDGEAGFDLEIVTNP